MAKIMGFELKAVKEHKDHDGYPVAQGNVYLNGRKLGEWSQDDWGGPDRYSFDVSPYNDALASIALPQHEVLDGIREHGLALDLDLLLESLLELRDDEREYKRLCKQGFTAVTGFSCDNRRLFIGERGEGAPDGELLAYAAQKMGARKENLAAKRYDAGSFIVGEPLAL